MNVRYYCAIVCVAKNSDFSQSIQIKPNTKILYELTEEGKSYVVLRSIHKSIIVRKDIFLDNFRVTRIWVRNTTKTL